MQGFVFLQEIILIRILKLLREISVRRWLFPSSLSSFRPGEEDGIVADHKCGIETE